MEQPDLKKTIAQQKLEEENKTQDTNKSIQFLLEDKSELEQEIKELKAQEIDDSNGTSIEVEIERKEQELFRLNNTISEMLGGNNEPLDASTTKEINLN